VLLLNGLADVLDGLADLPLAFTERLLRSARCLIGRAFVLKIGIVGHPSRSLLEFSLRLFDLAFNLIAVHIAPLLNRGFLRRVVHTCIVQVRGRDVRHSCDFAG